MLAHVDGGVVYSDGELLLHVEGEQAEGELFVERTVADTTGMLCNKFYGEYDYEDGKLVVHYEGNADEYENSEEGWAQAAHMLLNWMG